MRDYTSIPSRRVAEYVVKAFRRQEQRIATEATEATRNAVKRAKKKARAESTTHGSQAGETSRGVIAEDSVASDHLRTPFSIRPTTPTTVDSWRVCTEKTLRRKRIATVVFISVLSDVKGLVVA